MDDTRKHYEQQLQNAMIRLMHLEVAYDVSPEPKIKDALNAQKAAIESLKEALNKC